VYVEADVSNAFPIDANIPSTVSVESAGCIPPERIFLESIKVMRKKIRNVRVAAEQLTQVAVDEEMAE
jgi:hypothetical protein